MNCSSSPNIAMCPPGPASLPYLRSPGQGGCPLTYCGDCGKWAQREGHRMTTESERALRPLELEPLIRALTAGTLSGFVAGLIAGGVGSRIAMRIVAITAGDEPGRDHGRGG